jgi:serine/threonine protein kinase
MPEPRNTDAPDARSATDDSAPAPRDDTATAPSPPPGLLPAAGFGPPAEPGDVGTLGTYRIIQKIGQGNMGVVYLALDRRLGRRLALKVMLPEAAAELASRERFLREARAAALLTHDNVVTIYDADERDGVPYIAMQLLQGQSLDDWLRAGGKFDLRWVLRLARETASALAAAHAEGLAHRDIKPANLWLEAPSGRVKVLDFGLAKQLGADTDMTRTGVVLGTPRYMSPEQARGKDIDHRTDLFSLGSVLYLLCTGRPAFDGPHSMGVLTALIADDPEPIRQINPQVPEPFADLIHRLLVKKAADRVQSAQEVIDRVDEVLRALDAPRPAPAPVAPPVAPPPVAVVVPPPPAPPVVTIKAAPPLPPPSSVVKVVPPPPPPSSAVKVVPPPPAAPAPPATDDDVFPSLPEPISPAGPVPGVPAGADRVALVARARVVGGLQAVWDEAINAVLRDDWARWELCWDVVREVGVRPEFVKPFRKMVAGETRKGLLVLSGDARARLRAAFTGAAVPPPRPLLVPASPAELEPLLAAPPDWAGYTAFAVLSADAFNWLGHIRGPADRTKMRQRAREFMLTAAPPVVAAYLLSARPHLAADPGVIDVLFGTCSPPAAALLDRLLTAGALKPTDWKNLCAGGRLWTDEWSAFLFEHDRLANLLTGLGGTGTGADIWAAYVGLLTPALVSPELASADGMDWSGVHAWERKLHGHLRLAAERLTAAGLRLSGALSPAALDRLTAANALIRWLDDPAAAEQDGHDEVQRACRAFGVDRFEFVRLVYRRGGYDQLELPQQVVRLEPLLALFRAAFRPDGTLETARFAVGHWVRLSRDCPASSRAAFQAHFLLTCVFNGHYATLLHEPGAPPLEPEAVALLREAFPSAAPKKKRGWW